MQTRVTNNKSNFIFRRLDRTRTPFPHVARLCQPGLDHFQQRWWNTQRQHSILPKPIRPTFSGCGLARDRAETLFDNRASTHHLHRCRWINHWSKFRPRWERAARKWASVVRRSFYRGALTDVRGSCDEYFFAATTNRNLPVQPGRQANQQLSRLEELLVYVPDAGVVPLSSLAEMRGNGRY